MPRNILRLALILAIILPLSACDEPDRDYPSPRPPHVLSEGDDDDNGGGGGHP